MERLTIKELAPYLPYELKLLYQDDICYLDGINSDSLSVVTTDGGEYVNIIHVKPLLRPISDLFKLIDWDNNGDPYMIGYKYGVEKVNEDGHEFYADEYSADYCESPKCYVDITSINWWLFEYHFDVFNLIPSALALPIDGKEVEGE